MQQYKFSIIIPHKNIPDLLQRCLDSIPKRDDVQVIIVDDNSDPDKVDFEHFPGLGQPDTEVYFDKTGRGAGRARNVGLEHATGEWVLFADADDFYKKDNLNNLFDQSYGIASKLIIWGFEHRYFDGQCRDYFLDSDSAIKKIDDKKDLLGQFAPWTSMVRLEVIKKHGIEFEEIPASNDVMFHTLLLVNIQSADISWYPKIVYVWEQRKESITYTPSIKKIKCRFNASLRSNRLFLRQGWGVIDGTRAYLGELKHLSSWQFYIAFYREWFYLGFSIAYDDYCYLCHQDGSRLLLHGNPFVLISEVKEKLKNLFA